MPFFSFIFLEADQLTLSTDKQFIADFMPEYPIYVKLLAPEAQAVIGKPHPSTVPAMKLLQKEGFYYNDYIDIFDAGPVLESPLSNIKTYQSSQTFILQETTEAITGTHYLLANTHINFRATKATAQINIKDNTCVLSKKTARLLQIKAGEPVVIALF